jgi:hypothetical protein
VVEQALAAAGRPLNAFCAIELRIPKPLTRDGFDQFNRGYVEQLEKWGLRVNEQIPAARTNVAPEMEPPSGPCLHAFWHTIESQGRPTFVTICTDLPNWCAPACAGISPAHQSTSDGWRSTCAPQRGTHRCDSQPGRPNRTARLVRCSTCSSTAYEPAAPPRSGASPLDAGAAPIKPLAMRPDEVEDTAAELNSRVQIVSRPPDQTPSSVPQARGAMVRPSSSGVKE